MKRKLLAALLAAMLTLSLVACNKGDTGANVPISQNGSDDFQKNLHQTDELSFIETDTGYYFSYSSLYYIAKDTMKATEVCAKPDCDHTDDAVCNARIHADYLLTGGERIYYVGYETEPKTVGSVKLDATDRETIQELKFQETSASQSSYDPGIYHRGYVYYVSDDIVYRVKLGEEKDSAQIVWNPESPDTNSDPHIFNLNWMHYTLWADGDALYFMTNVQVEDGTHKDVLFQCDLTDMSVKQVWVTPGKDEVGEWERTGVKVSQWYVTNGYIYFYLSGGDMWRSELASGKMEKLADTREKAQYGSAVFSDEYMALLNDYSVVFYGDPTPKPGGMFRSFGDTIFVYGLDGTYIKEISLKGLYDDPADMAKIDMLCCSGKDIFFLTTGMRASELAGPFSGLTGNQGDINLCRADIETGKVDIVCNLKKGQ